MLPSIYRDFKNTPQIESDWYNKNYIDYIQDQGRRWRENINNILV